MRTEQERNRLYKEVWSYFFRIDNRTGIVIDGYKYKKRLNEIDVYVCDSNSTYYLAYMNKSDFDEHLNKLLNYFRRFIRKEKLDKLNSINK